MAVSEDKIEKTYYLLATILEPMSAQEQEGFFSKNGNPLFPFPPDEATLDEFLLKFGPPLIGEKTQEDFTKAIDGKELRALVDTYEQEYAKIAAVGKIAEAQGKKHTRELMHRALEAPVPVNQKGPLFQILEEKSEREPDKSIPEITREGVEIVAVKQASAPVPEDVRREVFNFSNLKDLKPLSKALAPIADMVTTVFPEFRAGAIRVILADSLDKMTKSVDKMTTLFGNNVVNEPWFKKIRDDAQLLVTQGSNPGGAKTVIDDVFVSLFRGAANPTVVAYIELYRINYAKGIPTPSISQLQAGGVGWESVLRTGVNIGLGRIEGGLISKGLISTGAKLLAGPEGWLIAAFQLASGLLGKVSGWFRGLVGMGGGFTKQDMWVLAFVLVPIFVLFVSQTSIQQDTNSALVRNLAGGGSGQIDTNPYLDVTITATPQSLVGNRPTAMTYNACVKPRGSADSFRINSADISISVYGSSGGAGPEAPRLTPDMFTDGCYEFTAPFGPELENSVVTATFNVNADAGSAVGVAGSASVSTVVGSPTNDILIPGPGGYQPGGWCDKNGASTPWSESDWGAMLGAVGSLSQYPQFLNLVRQYNPGGITVYRIPWSGNYWGCTSSDTTPIMFIYNGGIPNAAYILTHELGHRISSSSWFCEFKAQGIMSEGMTSYAAGEQYHVDEDFAEQFAQYVTNPGGLQSSLPRHYNFVQQVFGLSTPVHSPGCN